MIKVKAIETFNIAKFDELQNIQRVSAKQDGKIFAGDIFECTKPMYDYLTTENSLGRAFVKLIEYIPEKTIEVVTEQEEKPKRRRRKE